MGEQHATYWKALRCPVCGEDAEFFYTTTTDRTIVGCERCLITRHYWEFEEGELS